ncbi:hypothetical protein BMYO_0110 [Bifidobacterium myosotis]|uniref:GTPase n=1 Tax=Bifidobacterium myosotis TaxID=1630166 RepID=A0A261FS19_9BIFI|nr:hypothetical protein [Bifidobacterium myosotis]OZG61596.1 hypothetical protein BMYO_0110 [Bifidobacterium myosotis]
MNAEEQTTEPDRDAKSKRPTRHAKIMRGVVTPIFGLLAVTAIVLGVMNATMWKPSAEITASASVTGTQYIVTDAGVLNLLDQNTTLTAESKSSSDQVCVALGPAKDVTGWIGQDSYQRVTGMSSWSELSVERAGSGNSGGSSSSSDDSSDSSGTSGSAAGSTAGTAAGSTAKDEVAFKDSEMWTSVKCGKGSATLNVTKATGATVAIVDLGDEASAATVKLHWVRSQVPDFAMPFYLSGGLLAVIAVLCASVFAMPPHKRRNKRIIEGTAHEIVEAGLSFAERAERAAAGGAPSYPAAAANGGRKRRRHAGHRRGAKPAGESVAEERPQSPVIIDPASRNLVADQQHASAASTESPAAVLAGSAEHAGNAASDATGVSGASAASAASSESGQSAAPNGTNGTDGPRESRSSVASADADVESTSVITPDELQAYFARLARESQESNTNGDAQNDGQGESR